MIRGQVAYNFIPTDHVLAIGVKWSCCENIRTSLSSQRSSWASPKLSCGDLDTRFGAVSPPTLETSNFNGKNIQDYLRSCILGFIPSGSDFTALGA
ncbi:hypothetical protein BaRGS_00005451 [Batillaria attramentaria]|uniref:Uncharacterized protein n=1 Tax=Batillaria attramentaria TaxID=370345 RepID=A0ABD0LUI1_9CAEN